MALKLSELAERFGGEVHGDPDTTVSKVATLAAADSDSLGFLANPLYAPQLGATAAGIVVLNADAVDDCPCAALVVKDPYLTYALIASELYPDPELQSGVHPSAVIDPQATVADSCQVGPGVVIEAGVQVGDAVVLGANCVLSRGVSIGAHSRLHPNVVLYDDVMLGERCVLHSGVVIGARGFGIAKQADASWINVPQIGSVTLGNDVEIGANSCIDRGAIEDTVLEDGVKLDNLIQIGHNVHIGAHTALAGQSGVAGSTKIGANCLIGGRATINGHIEICDHVAVTGAAGITHSITKPGIYSGGIVPMDDAVSHRKNSVRFKQLDKMARTLKKLERAVFKDEG